MKSKTTNAIAQLPLLTRSIFFIVLASALLNACTMGPDYVRPQVEVPAGYRELNTQTKPQKFDGWKVATPQNEHLSVAWWELYNDPLLSSLVQQVDISNQNIQIAAAQYRQAQSVVAQTRASWFPNIGADLTHTRSQGITTGSTVTPGAVIHNANRFTLNAAWELDLWGRISRSIEANSETANASAADLAAARLSAQTTLVQNYLQLRINDAQQNLLVATVAAYQRSYEITRNRYQAGIAPQTEVAQAESQLKSTQAQAINLKIQRTQIEHAIAVLLGKAPAEFHLATLENAAENTPHLPQIPVSLPSELIERRPDISAAERRVATANAQIGVAQAAFFPTINLSGNGGYQSSSFADLVSVANRFWSVGPALALSLFDAGAKSAAKDQAIANYDKNVALYRQTVLTAFQEVEDNLVATRLLAEEKETQSAATRAAEQFQNLTNNQYLAGTVSFLNVATAQTTALSARRASLDVLNRQLAASIGLVKALGGGDWRPFLTETQNVNQAAKLPPSQSAN